MFKFACNNTTWRQWKLNFEFVLSTNVFPGSVEKGNLLLNPRSWPHFQLIISPFRFFLEILLRCKHRFVFQVNLWHVYRTCHKIEVILTISKQDHRILPLRLWENHHFSSKLFLIPILRLVIDYYFTSVSAVMRAMVGFLLRWFEISWERELFSLFLISVHVVNLLRLPCKYFFNCKVKYFICIVHDFNFFIKTSAWFLKFRYIRFQCKTFTLNLVIWIMHIHCILREI